MNHKTLTLIALLLALSATLLAQMNSARGYVVVTDFIQEAAGKDVSDDIQRVIVTNPNRTIYFPDGIYIISKPILTPADPQKSVALELSNFAIIRAAEDWASEEAMIRLGGKDPANKISTPGSNYYLKGGVPVPADGPDPAAREKTMAYSILRAHDRSGGQGKMRISFDAMVSHDITYVGIIQTARASGMKEFPIPYALTNCHNSLCAVGGTINEDDHAFGLSAAMKYGGIFVPSNQAVMAMGCTRS